jgi:multidrug efflux pump subunit AcrA (membrane-fusion protein)
MKFADLLRLNKGAPPSSGDLRQAIERAEAAAREASERLDALTAERAAALVEDDDATLDRVEGETIAARRDLDRAELAVEELQRRLVETEAAEEQARIDGLHAQATAACARIVELIRGPYTQLASELRALMLEIEELDQTILVNNRKLLEERLSPVAHGEEVVAPHRRPRVAIYDALHLPSPDDPGVEIWPPDRFLAASQSFAKALDAAYAKARGG